MLKFRQCRRVTLRWRTAKRIASGSGLTSATGATTNTCRHKVRYGGPRRRLRPGRRSGGSLNLEEHRWARGKQYRTSTVQQKLGIVLAGLRRDLSQDLLVQGR